MTSDLIKSLPARRGHFLLESGYHSDFWFTLDALHMGVRFYYTQPAQATVKANFSPRVTVYLRSCAAEDPVI